MCKQRQQQRADLVGKSSPATAKAIEKFAKARSQEATDFLYKRLKTLWIMAALRGLELRQCIMLCDMVQLEFKPVTLQELRSEFPETKVGCRASSETYAPTAR